VPLLTPPDLARLEADLSAALLKLQYLPALGLRDPLPAGASFEVTCCVAGRAGVDAAYFEEDRRAELAPPVAGRPLKTVALAPGLALQVLYEEGRA